MLQDRIRRQISSSPLALSRVSEHKRPSSGRLGAACPSACALALHLGPPKFTTVGSLTGAITTTPASH